MDLQPRPDISGQGLDFIDRVAAFHRERGTSFETEPKIGSRVVRLEELYEAVKARGGYDILSATRLAWRELSRELKYGGDATSAFNLKTIFYKYLAAYAIRVEYNRTPPPPEILEHISAKGGDLLNRTLENFAIPTARIVGPEAGPFNPQVLAEDGIDVESGEPVGRRLRPHPTPAHHFQPDTSSTRQPRRSLGRTQSPSSAGHGQRSVNSYNPYSDPNSTLFNLNNYDPLPQVAQNVRPLVTPGFNADAFERHRGRDFSRGRPEASQYNSREGVMPPGTGFSGPNIYSRCLMSLKCPILDEQEFAVHHLVKISYERGDKFRFEAFVGLDDALLARSLETASLFYDVEWDVSYDCDGKHLSVTNVLDGCRGTPNLLEKIQSLVKKDVLLTDREYSRRLNVGTSASLVLRNMLQLEENVFYEHQTDNMVLKDWLVIALNFPNIEETLELKVNALEICAIMTRYYTTDGKDPLYKTLVGLLCSNDRAFIRHALTALNSFATELPGPRHKLVDIPCATIRRLFDLLLLRDDSLTKPILDFFYQFTATDENVYKMVSDEDMNLPAFCRNVSYCLSYRAMEARDTMIKRPEVRAPPPEEIPQAPHELLLKLSQLAEPDRSSLWLKCCFREDADASVTQIDLWKAYQIQFAAYGQRRNLQAADFIKNVSNTFKNATAQVVPSDNQPKFIIKGIRPGHHPMDVDGLRFLPCLWMTDHGQCRRYIKEPKELYDHVMRDHLGQYRNAEGGFDEVVFEKPQFCLWNDCRKFFAEGGASTLSVLRRHVWTHMPYEPEMLGISRGHFEQNRPQSPTVLEKEQTVTVRYLNTPRDENGPCGIAYVAMLVLRNIAGILYEKQDDPAREQLTNAMWDMRYRLKSMVAEDQTLGEAAFGLLDLIERAGDRTMGRLGFDSTEPT